MAKIVFMVKNILHYYFVVKKISGKSKFFDLLLSRVLIGLPYDRYVDFCFYNKPWHNRRDYLYSEWKYYIKYNPGVTRDNHDDKSDVMDKIVPYLNRTILKTNDLSFEKFKSFVQGKKNFFYKPVDGDSGLGVEKIVVNKSLEFLYSEIMSKGKGILEETVVQHEYMNRMNPNLVQTIRFFVCKKKDGSKILFSTMRTSLKENVCVDNAGAGGAFANVDLNTGLICTNAFSEINAVAENFDPHLVNEIGIDKHPVTGTAFKGFKIPFFTEAKELVLNISDNTDFYGRRLLGFDIAISDKGPVVIEVNVNRPGISELWQIPLKNNPLRPILEQELKSI